jgi:predicted nucleic-acid-binding Zn-ribbon protein
MRRFLTIPVYIVLIVSAITTISCAPEACYEETNAFVKAFMRDNDTGEPKAPDSLTVYGLDLDSVKIYNKARNIQPALLPLNASASSCTFIVIINGTADTVTFNYSSYIHLISMECGYTFFHNIDTVVYTTNIIDYIFTADKKITTENVENLRIFY